MAEDYGDTVVVGACFLRSVEELNEERDIGYVVPNPFLPGNFGFDREIAPCLGGFGGGLYCEDTASLMFERPFLSVQSAVSCGG